MAAKLASETGSARAPPRDSTRGRTAGHCRTSRKCASSPAIPAAGRGPRSFRSSARTASSHSRRFSPSPPTSGCLSKASSATGRQFLGRRAGDGQEQRAGGGRRQRLAGAVVGLDAPPREQCRNPPRELPVGRDQRGRFRRGFERLAQRQRNRLSFGRRISQNRETDARQAPLGRAQRLPFVREIRRGHGIGDGPRPRRRGRGSARPTPALHLRPRNSHPVEKQPQVILRVRRLAPLSRSPALSIPRRERRSTTTGPAGRPSRRPFERRGRGARRWPARRS